MPAAVSSLPNTPRRHRHDQPREGRPRAAPSCPKRARRAPQWGGGERSAATQPPCRGAVRVVPRRRGQQARRRLRPGEVGEVALFRGRSQFIGAGSQARETDTQATLAPAPRRLPRTRGAALRSGELFGGRGVPRLVPKREAGQVGFAGGWKGESRPPLRSNCAATRKNQSRPHPDTPIKANWRRNGMERGRGLTVPPSHAPTSDGKPSGFRS